MDHALNKTKMSPRLVDGNFSLNFFKNLREYLNLHILCDCLLRVETQQSLDSQCHSHEFYAHRLVLAATCSFFKEIFLLKKDQKDPMTIVNLKLHSPNAVNCFKVVLDYLYSGELNLRDCDPYHVFQVAKVCQITVLEEQLRPQSPTKSLKQDYLGLGLGLKPVPSVSMANEPIQLAMVSTSTPQAVHLQTIAATEPMRNTIQYMTGYYGALLPTATNLLPSVPQSAPAYPPPVHQDFPPMIRAPHPNFGPLMSMSSPGSLTLPMNEPVPRAMEIEREQPTSPKATAKNGANAKLTRLPSPPFNNLGDIIIPSSDKEGWCRNKKYIERVPNGFMCTVCRKVYGRYNSVSYHVTIYHRNPPIKCDESGCKFTTREARYIHFHKYYRHNIALPQSVDLGSRKCPFCRHVSKSPAMLEKHISRHMPDSNRVVRMYQCPQCPKQLSSQRAMYDHKLTHTEDKNYPCDQCNYKGQTESNLRQHVLFKHSSEMFKKMRCEIKECNFTCATIEQMQEHKTRVHEIQVHSISHSSNHRDEEIPLTCTHEHEDIDVDGKSKSINKGEAVISPIPVTQPPVFVSIVDDNGNFVIGNISKQLGLLANSSGTSLDDDHRQLASYSADNEPVVTQDSEWCTVRDTTGG